MIDITMAGRKLDTAPSPVPVKVEETEPVKSKVKLTKEKINVVPQH